MVERTTHDIKVIVSSQFLTEPSMPASDFFLFGYRIRIENNSNRVVQLLSRYWRIVDSNGTEKVVEGDGVIGKTPEIHPGGAYIYQSGCDLTTEMGFMEGYYNFKNLEDQSDLKVLIPRFKLEVPWKNN